MLAIDYFDGATEGFIDQFEGAGPYFFKVIAWDSDQNKRLYSMARVDCSTFSELVDLLSQTHPPVSTATWIPTWNFDDEKLRSRANAIVDAARRSLQPPVLLAVGEDLLAGAKVVQPNALGMAFARDLTQASKPGELEAWLSRSFDR